MKCLNENCPLCRNHKCLSDFVSMGKASCVSSYKVTVKQQFKPKFNYRFLESEKDVRVLKVYR